MKALAMGAGQGFFYAGEEEKMERNLSEHPLSREETDALDRLIQKVTDEYAYTLGSGEICLNGCFSSAELFRIAEILKREIGKHAR